MAADDWIDSNSFVKKKATFPHASKDGSNIIMLQVFFFQGANDVAQVESSQGITWLKDAINILQLLIAQNKATVIDLQVPEG